MTCIKEYERESVENTFSDYDIFGYYLNDFTVDKEIKKHLIKLAIDKIEKALGISILKKKFLYEHNNPYIILPYPPICKINKVYKNKKEMSEDEYTFNYNGRYYVFIKGQSGEKDTFKIDYVSGYEKDTLPPSINSYIMRIAANLYKENHKHEIEIIKEMKEIYREKVIHGKCAI